MMYFSDMTVFTFQVTAALMMGWDYLMPARWREKVNNKLRNRFVTIQSNVDTKMIDFIKEITSNYKVIIVSVFMIILGLVVINNINVLMKIGYPSVAFFIALIGTISLALGGFFLLNLVSNIITHFFISGVIPRILLTFLIMTEKGPFAGMGFIVLLVSFFMRYQNIIHLPIK
ncbi:MULTISPECIES: hypothetical protein [Pantoea]|uniref:hypothetical protein n=1 Tax=Pantoea TaxID=53335 RepID=UPI001303A15D|nr:hypothetical protein [Pantoea agglomerans]